jgi:hypothetical protein
MQNPITVQLQMFPAVFWLQTVFGTAALICAIVAMATNHVNKGFALLIASSVSVGVCYFMAMHTIHNATQELVDPLNKQSIEVQQQMQKMFQLPPAHR